jgi:hypothetical protein
MKPHIITDGGEELVVLSRRDYDPLLARLGEEEAEDRMTARIVADSRARIVSGEEKRVAADADGRPLDRDGCLRRNGPANDAEV